MGIFVKCWLFFYDAHSPNMVMSRDPSLEMSKLFYFVPILYLISGKVTKFLVEKLSISEVISQKPHGGEWKTPFLLPAPLGLKKKSLNTRSLPTRLLIRGSLSRYAPRSFDGGGTTIPGLAFAEVNPKRFMQSR